MVNAFTIESRLNIKSNVPELLRGLIADFERLEKHVADSTRSISRLVGELRGISEAARGLASLSKTLGKVGRGETGLAKELTRAQEAMRGMAEAQANMARSAQEMVTAYREIGAGAGGRGPGGPRVPPGAGPGHRRGRGRPHLAGAVMDAGIGGMIAGDVGGTWLTDALRASFEVDHLLAQFRQNTGVGDTDIAAIRKKAEDLTRMVPGSTIAENLHTILDAYTVTGHIGEALAAAPGLARLALVLKSLPGRASSDPAYAAAQTVELLQRYYNPKTGHIDMREFTRNVEAETRVAVGTGGRVTPEQYRAYAKQSRAAGMTADDQFLYEDLPAVLIALGGSRAGTAHAAIYQQMLTGKMTKQAMIELQKLGILDKSAHWQGGRVQDIEHHLPGFKLMAQDYVEWVREYGFKALKAHGIDPKDRQAVALALARIASRQTGLAGLAEVFLGIAGIDKEAAKIRATSGDPLKNIEAYDPLQKVREFAAATNEFQVTLGQFLTGPAIDSLKQLTAGLRELTDWAKDHPNIGHALADTAGGLVLLAKAIGAVGMSLLAIGPIIGLARLLIGGGAGAGAAGGGAAAAGGAAAGAGVLARFGAVLSSPLGVAVTTAVLAWLGSRAEEHGASRVLEAQQRATRRSADAWGRTPTDGFDVMGRPIGAPREPVPVILMNPGDLTNGVTGFLGMRLGMPSTGSTGLSDFRVQLGNGLGATP